MESYYTHNTGTFVGKGGIEIYFQSWTVPMPKGIIIIIHGLGEHSGRYKNLLLQFKNKKMSFFAMDLRGHGKSAGKRGHIETFMDYIYDLKLFIDLIKQKNEKTPFFMFGHSLGGVIASKYILTFPDDITGMVLSSPAFLPVIKVAGWKKNLASLFSTTFSRITMSSGIKAEHLSHDSDVIEAYENDNLVHDRASARFYLEYTKSAQECLAKTPEIKTPLLCLHSKDDPIADFTASQVLHDTASSKIKNIYLFNGLLHEPINESEEERNMVLKIVNDWIEKVSNKKNQKSQAVSDTKTEKKEETPASAPKKTVQKKAAPKKAAKAAPKKTAKKTVKKAKTAPSKKKAAPKKATKSTAKKTAKKTTTKKK